MWEHLRMESKDDPEARIRELERGISDQARASELGGGSTELGTDASATSALPPPLPPPLPGPYGTPYPPPPSYEVPPPGSFGTPYPPGPASFGEAPFSPVPSRSGFRIGWLFFAIFAFVGIAIIGSVVAVFYSVSNSMSTIESNFPTFPGDGSFTNSPSAPGLSSTPITAGNNVSVAGSGKHQTLVCDGGSVTVSGMSNTVDITGHCASVTVSGVQNKVTVESADGIEASGMKNAVTYRSGSPRLNNSGLDNSIDEG
jgi:hypothetical protein